VLGALRSPLRPRTLDAIKRRTRAMTGRCQSFHCLLPLARTLARELGTPLHRVTKRGAYVGQPPPRHLSHAGGRCVLLGGHFD
jgi:glycerol-3-phosphate dehydrogenase